MSGFGGKTGQGRLAVGEGGITRQWAGLEGVVAIAADLSSELKAVLSMQVAEGVLIHVALGGIHVLATHAKERGNRNVPAEAQRREAVVGNPGNSQRRSDLVVVGDVVAVVKAVVAHGGLVDHAAADRPRVGDADLGTADHLPLHGVERLPGERQEGSTAVSVETVSMIPGKRAPQLLLAGEHMV